MPTSALGASLQITGVVEDQYRARVAQLIEDVLSHVIAHRVGIPHRLAEQPLHPMWCTVSGLLSQLPTGQLSTSDNRPSRNARACRRGSTRRNRPAMYAKPDSNSSTHSSAATLCPAAAARSLVVSTSH
jgi:hypothetical protein